MPRHKQLFFIASELVEDKEPVRKDIDPAYTPKRK